MSPHPGGRLRFKWRGRSVELILPGGLRPDKTYVVTVGTGARDLRRNSMQRSYTFAFSTGAHLDRGEMSGQVRGPERIRSGVYVWAYDVNRIETPHPMRDDPDYATQTSEERTYRFLRVSPGSYRLFAFSDRDGDRRYTPGKDLLGVPSEDIAVTDTLHRANDLYLARRDTLGPALRSARASDRRHLTLRFDKEIDLRRPVEFQILRAPSDSTAAPREDLRVLEAYDLPTDASTVHLLTDEQISEMKYTVDVVTLFDPFGNLVVDEGRIATFTGSAVPDTAKPRVRSFSPEWEDEEVFPNQRLEIHFSEAMPRFSLGDDFWLRSDSTAAPVGTFTWLDAISLIFDPEGRWEEGRAYLLRGDLTGLSDPSGNAPPEGTIRFSFTVIASGGLGSFSGFLSEERGQETGSFYLQAERIGDRSRKTGPASETYSLKVERPGAYTWDRILPGAYLVSAFHDKNRDSAQNYGRILPFIPAEPAASYPDTVFVRARWETKGVDIRFY